MNKKFIQFFVIILFLMLAFFLAWTFYFGFVLIVRPPFADSELETLEKMKDFCIEKGIKNFLVSVLLGLITSVLIWRFVFRNFNFLWLFIIFIVIANMGNILGIKKYYYELQGEFKNHQFKN